VLNNIVNDATLVVAIIKNGEIWCAYVEGANVIRKRYTLGGTLLEQVTIFTRPLGYTTFGISYTASPDGIAIRYGKPDENRFLLIDWNGSIIAQTTTTIGYGGYEYTFPNGNILLSFSGIGSVALRNIAGTQIWSWNTPYQYFIDVASFIIGGMYYKGVVSYDTSGSADDAWLITDGTSFYASLNSSSYTMSNKLIGMLARPY
jgi:hypothetical protein